MPVGNKNEKKKKRRKLTSIMPLYQCIIKPHVHPRVVFEKKFIIIYSPGRHHTHCSRAASAPDRIR